MHKLDGPSAFPKLLVLSNRVDSGTQEFNCNHIPHLQHLMKMASFCGMVGGVAS